MSPGSTSADIVRCHVAGLAGQHLDVQRRRHDGRLIDWGIDGICTDVPELLVARLAASVIRRSEWRRSFTSADPCGCARLTPCPASTTTTTSSSTGSSTARTWRAHERRRAAHDEMLFIVVHQTYELWFKQILWELDDVLSCFAGDELREIDIARVIARLQRIVEIQHVLIGQIDVLETMTPLDFLEFRDLLVPASGFQSMQFRLIENRLGVRPEDRVTFGGARYTERLHGEQREARRLPRKPNRPCTSTSRTWLERTPFLDSFDFWSAYQRAVRTMLEADRRIVAEQREPHRRRAAKLS